MCSKCKEAIAGTYLSGSSGPATTKSRVVLHELALLFSSIERRGDEEDGAVEEANSVRASLRA